MIGRMCRLNSMTCGSAELAAGAAAQVAARPDAKTRPVGKRSQDIGERKRRLCATGCLGQVGFHAEVQGATGERDRGGQSDRIAYAGDSSPSTINRIESSRRRASVI